MKQKEEEEEVDHEGGLSDRSYVAEQSSNTVGSRVETTTGKKKE